MKTLWEISGEAEDFTAEDAKQLASLLSSHVVRRAVKAVREEAEAISQNLLSAKLESEAGRLEALRMQGVYRGMLRAVEILDSLQQKEA